MNVSISIPEDIVEAIIDELCDDHDTLKTTSFVSRSFLSLSQKHLFSSVELDLSHVDTALQQSRRLLAVFASNPNTALYVRKFSLVNYAESAWELDATSISRQLSISDDILPALFKMLRQVRSLSFSFLSPNRRDVQNWMRNSTSLSSAVLDLCLSPSVVSITIRNVGNFPLHILSHCRCVKRITLRNLQYAGHKASNIFIPEVDAAVEETMVPGTVDILELDSSFHVTLPRITSVMKEPNSKLDISHLRALRVTGPFVSWKLDLGLKTIEDIAQTLECFMWCEVNDWEGNHTMSSQFDSDALNLVPMINLRFMVFTFIFNIHTLDWLVESLERISGKNLVEEISVVLFPDAWEDNEVKDQLPVWVSRLHSVLLGSGFSYLKKVSIYVGWFLNDFPKQMPPLPIEHGDVFSVRPLYTDLAGLWNSVLIKAGILR